jgi:hypothetical protein
VGREQQTAPPNQVYYLEVGVGDWDGRFTFRVTDRAAFRRDRLGPRNRLLSLWLAGTFRLIGWGAITSSLRRVEEAAPALVVGNRVRLHRFGVTLYLLRESYTLDPDGTDVLVVAHERFGPLPFLFRDSKRHTARVVDGGMRAVYDLPLLGASWRAVYEVHPDRGHVDSTLTCAWAEAHERIAKA